MTGRGIDQILPYAVHPQIYESYVKDARDYVVLAEKANGSIDKPVTPSYIWGDALQVWLRMTPDLKIVNLETSITLHDDPWPEKGINYRMHPKNLALLLAAGIDCCALANNHILDWNRKGLVETLDHLENAGISYAGAGRNAEEAAKPAKLKTEKGRVIVFAYGSVTSGVPPEWSATEQLSGVNLLPNLQSATVEKIRKQIKAVAEENDVVVLSVHWGTNWGYDIPEQQRSFAHQLIDEADVDVIHGHSSHHPKGMEVYHGKLIIYGAGDFINDYEGIRGYEQFRDDLTLMYFPTIAIGSGRLTALTLVPMQIKNLRLNHVTATDAKWLHAVLDFHSRRLGIRLVLESGNSFTLKW